MLCEGNNENYGGRDGEKRSPLSLIKQWRRSSWDCSITRTKELPKLPFFEGLLENPIEANPDQKWIHSAVIAPFSL